MSLYNRLSESNKKTINEHNDLKKVLKSENCLSNLKFGDVMWIKSFLKITDDWQLSKIFDT